MAQVEGNNTKPSNIYNFNEHSTSSDVILLIRSMVCYREAFVAAPCPSHHQHCRLWESLSICVIIYVLYIVQYANTKSAIIHMHYLNMEKAVIIYMCYIMHYMNMKKPIYNELCYDEIDNNFICVLMLYDALCGCEETN